MTFMLTFSTPSTSTGLFSNSLSITKEKDLKNRGINFGDEQPKLESLSSSLLSTSTKHVDDLFITDKVHDLHIPEFNFSINLPFESKQGIILVVKSSFLLQEMLSEINRLLENEYNWDEIGYRKPTHEDIIYAKNVLKDFVFTVNSEGYSVNKPYISNSEYGGASIKWKIGQRTLYLEIARDESVVFKIWKESGKIIAKDETLFRKDYLTLWKWVINE